MKQNLKILSLGVLAGLIFGLVITPTFAVITCYGPDQEYNEKTNRCELKNPAQGQLVDIRNFGTLAQRIIQILLATGGAVAVIFLMIGGFQYVTARGNEEAMEKAKKTVTGSIIGIVLIVMAFAIVAIVNNLLTTPQN